MLKGFGKVVDGLKKSVQNVISSNAQFKEDMSWELAGEGIAMIKAQTQSGSLEIQGADQTMTQVKAEKRVQAPTQEEAEAFAPQVEVHVAQEGDEIVMGVDHPEPPVGVSVSVSFQVAAPRQVAVAFETGSGGIKIADIDDEVNAEAGSGSIKVSKCKTAVDVQTGSGSITIAECEGKVDADTGSGSVRLQKIAGDASVHTASGKIRVTSIQGDLEAKTDSGTITVRGSEGAVDLQTSSGRISAELQNLVGKANFRTSSGSVNIKLLEGAAPITARTHSGSITASFPVEFSGNLDAQSVSGSIRCEFPIVAEAKVKGHLKGKIGQGEGPLLDLQTASGRIDITAQGKLETKV